MRTSISGMPRLDSDIEQKASLFVFVALFYKSQELNILGGCRGMVSDEILEFHALFYPNSQALKWNFTVPVDQMVVHFG
ncbi:hypothetical protein D5086_006005 [Populus alba]|uniref:Uncharacterized protein n=1 Tax=Populus alba TaxID=43335 RepID=A0ACC4CKF7_POPAL